MKIALKKRTDIMRNQTTLLCLGLAAFLAISSGRGTGGQDTRTDVLTVEGYEAAARVGRATIGDMMAKAQVPGVGVAVAVNGKIVWAEGFGLADLERRAAVTRRTKFGLGSVTKSLTMALAARLTEEKVLDLDAPLERYLPDFLHKGKGITIRLIGCHLSGLDDTVAAGLMYTSTRHSSEEALQLMYGETMKYASRERSHYTTGPFTLVAAAAERTTRQSFPDLMRRYVTGPLGMTDTVPNDRRAVIEGRTCFYVREGDRTLNARYFDPSHKLAGAGYLATAEDLARFGAALLRSGFVKAETADELFQALPTAAGEVTPFALGWRVVKDRTGRQVIAQPGGGPGIAAQVSLYRREQLVIAVLANLSGAPVGLTVLDPIADAFLGAAGAKPAAKSLP